MPFILALTGVLIAIANWYPRVSAAQDASRGAIDAHRFASAGIAPDAAGMNGPAIRSETDAIAASGIGFAGA